MRMSTFKSEVAKIDDFETMDQLPLPEGSRERVWSCRADCSEAPRPCRGTDDMKIIAENIWLCQDCLMVAVNGDYTGLDYAYSELEADAKARCIDAGLAQLPHLVPDFDLNEDWWECLDCGLRSRIEDCPTVPDPDGDGGTVHSCNRCQSVELRRRDDGYEEFSTKDCDCCGTALAGSRHRFAQLGEDDVHD